MIINWGSNNHNSEQNETKDYSKFSNDQLLDSFKSDNWSQMKENDRVGVIQELENRTAAEQGREPAVVVSASRVTSYGSFNSTTNQMNINVSNFSSYETLDTFAHESNHAYQTYCVNNGIGYDEYTRNMIGVETARDQNGNLYNYARTSPQYDMQCNELDSNNKAASFVIGEKDRYSSDPVYKDYVAERDSHFKDVNTALDNNQAMRTSMQNDQTYTSYVRSDITEEIYNSLLESINDPNHVDPTVSESHTIGVSLSLLNEELNADLNEERTEENNSYADGIGITESESSAETVDVSRNDSNDNDNSIGIS